MYEYRVLGKARPTQRLLEFVADGFMSTDAEKKLRSRVGRSCERDYAESNDARPGECLPRIRVAAAVAS